MLSPNFSADWPWILSLLASTLLISGLDDLVPACIRLFFYITRDTSAKPATLDGLLGPEGRIAVFVPCWNESEVIGNMVRHNMAAVSYLNFDFFLGVYPNDQATLDVAMQLAATFNNVHVARCGNPGPTSKADCLNWAYAAMCAYEDLRGVKFETVVLHDAEDLIHPEAFQIINRERSTYGMVQVPVLPLPTPFSDFTHGIYCDDFAEYQTIDMPARQLSGSFVPSNGVGTGFAREILEELGEGRKGLVFDPASLTEDYEIGVHIHQSGYRQCFAPLEVGAKGYRATREYFPRRVRSAIRQRTRWVTGIALQCWERSGWRGSWKTRYWFWRDRKGLIANPVSLLTNVLFIAGLADLAQSVAEHRPWKFAVANPFVFKLCLLASFLQIFRMGLRMYCVGRIFGFVFSLGVPLRYWLGNFINCMASFGALSRFAAAKIRRRPLVWLKTEHSYPTRGTLVAMQRDLKEVILASGFVSQMDVEALIAQLEPGWVDADLAAAILARGLVSEETLCKILSLQSGVTTAAVDARTVNKRVLRSLPLHLRRRFDVLPVAVRAGRLLIAGWRVPPAHFFEELRSFTKLVAEFQLVTRKNYEELLELL